MDNILVELKQFYNTMPDADLNNLREQEACSAVKNVFLAGFYLIGRLWTYQIVTASVFYSLMSIILYFSLTRGFAKFLYDTLGPNNRPALRK